MLMLLLLMLLLLLLLLLSECLLILVVIGSRGLHGLHLVQSGVPGRDFVAVIEQAQVVFADIGFWYADQQRSLEVTYHILGAVASIVLHER